MPPEPVEFRGPLAVVGYLQEHLRGEELRLVPTRANNQPAFVVYHADPCAPIWRASSLVENVNSRLRTYFFLRRHLGPDYLELLRFFLNHRRLPRSERAERVGKSPAELLTGQRHGHWLELLGYQRFARQQRPAA